MNDKQDNGTSKTSFILLVGYLGYAVYFTSSTTVDSFWYFIQN